VQLTLFRYACLIFAAGTLSSALTGARPGVATLVTVTLSAMLLALLVRRTAALPALVPVGTEALRRSVGKPALTRQRDPDASGRPRPRAPSAA
jgi:hypothetical protein